MTSPEQVDAAVKGTPWPIRRQGSGATVLVLHGSTGAASWAGAQEALSAGHTVLLPTHPGFDGTTRPDWLDRISDLAQAYLELIDTQGWGQVHLVGHELGGWLAAEMAVRQPSAVASLSLISSQGLPVAPDAVGLDTFLLTDEQRWLDSIHDPALARDLAGQPRDEADTIAAREEASRRVNSPYAVDAQTEEGGKVRPAQFGQGEGLGKMYYFEMDATKNATNAGIDPMARVQMQAAKPGPCADCGT